MPTSPVAPRTPSRSWTSAEDVAEALKAQLEPVLLQARDVGAAIVDEATERGADLLVVGLPYRKRFGGEFAIGRTIPYILQNAPCAVWVVREPMSEETVVKIVIVGCGRVGARRAEVVRPRRPRGHRPRHVDAGVRPPAGDVRRPRHPRRRHRRGRPASGRRRGRRRVPRPDRGRQPQRHGRAARDRGARRRQGHRQDQRPGPRRGLRRARHRDAVPDRPDARRRERLPRAPSRRGCRRCSPRPATTRAAQHHDLHEPDAVGRRRRCPADAGRRRGAAMEA